MKRIYKRTAVGSSVIFGVAVSTLTIFAHPALALMGIGLIATGYHGVEHIKKKK